MHLQKWDQKAVAFWTLTMCGITNYLVQMLKSHAAQHLLNSHDRPFSLHIKSSVARLPVQACSLFTHTTLTHCEDLPSATLTITEWNWVREIHFGFSFFLSLMCFEAVVMVMGYKDSSSSQCTHEWEEHWGCVCEYVPVNESTCLSCVIPKIMP